MNKKDEAVKKGIEDEVVEGKDIIVKEAAGQSDFFDDGLGEACPEDFIVPTIKVGQDKHPPEVLGKLFIDIENDAIDEMTLVVLRRHKERVLFDEDYDEGNKPLCKSSNFITPNICEDFVPMNDVCEECKYSKWTKSSSRKMKPPRCSEVWFYLTIDYDTFMPAWFPLKSKALKPAKKLYSMLKVRGKIKKIPAWGFKFAVTVALDHSGRGPSYVPVFSGLTELEKDELEDTTETQKQFINIKTDFDDNTPPPADEDEEF